MRKFTQQELLEEGFWNAFKTVAKGVAKVVDPELYNKVASDATAIKNFGSQVKQAYIGPEKALTASYKKAGNTDILVAQQEKNIFLVTGKDINGKPFRNMVDQNGKSVNPTQNAAKKDIQIKLQQQYTNKGYRIQVTKEGQNYRIVGTDQNNSPVNFKVDKKGNSVV